MVAQIMRATIETDIASRLKVNVEESATAQVYLVNVSYKDEVYSIEIPYDDLTTMDNEKHIADAAHRLSLNL